MEIIDDAKARHYLDNADPDNVLIRSFNFFLEQAIDSWLPSALAPNMSDLERSYNAGGAAALSALREILKNDRGDVGNTKSGI